MGKKIKVVMDIVLWDRQKIISALDKLSFFIIFIF